MFNQSQFKHVILHSTYAYSRKAFILAPAVALLGILTLISAFFLTSDLASNSYAIDDPNATMVDDQHYVSLSVSNVDLSFTPTAGSLVDSKQVGVTISTNIPTGAKLYLSTADNTNALYKDGDTSSSSPAIQPTNSTTTLANMPVNTWGYSLDNTTFQAVPTSDSAALIANVDGSTVGTTSGDVISATVPVYYGAKVDSSLPAGTYSNKVVYSAIGTIPVNISSVTVSVDGETSDNLQVDKTNTITITTDLMTSEFGTPRVYYTTTNPSGTTECGNVNVAKNSQGYMTIACTVTPTAAANGVILHITQGSSGDWKWGEFEHSLPDIVSPVRLMSDISTMQEMTPEFCASVTMESPNNTARLQDTRDGKYYWVAKLADGNCWMTQNLDLDLNGRTLSPTDSDVSSNWRFNGSWYSSASQGSFDNTAIQAWNLGDVVWKRPDGSSYCNDISNNLYNSSCSGTWQDIRSGWVPMSSIRNDGVSIEGNTYDAHYTAGNYYSYGAATAGTGNNATVNGAIATDSICSTGWELPTASGDGSFYNLLAQYGLTNSPANNTYNIVMSPLYFVRAGSSHDPNRELSYAGYYGEYLTSTSASSSFPYMLFFGPISDGRVYPNSGNIGGRYEGLSVRCVAAR